MTTTATAMRARHDAILAAIRASLADRGYPPSISEIAQALGCAPSTALLALRRMETLGKIRRVPGMERRIEIVDDDQAVTDAPARLDAAADVLASAGLRHSAKDLRHLARHLREHDHALSAAVGAALARPSGEPW